MSVILDVVCSLLAGLLAMPRCKANHAPLQPLHITSPLPPCLQHNVTVSRILSGVAQDSRVFSPYISQPFIQVFLA